MKAFTAVLALAAPGAVCAQTFGNWVVDEIPSERAVYAASVNESGGLLGKTCTPDGCLWIVTSTVKCEAGAKYPALLNADAAAWHITLVCAPNDKSASRYYVQEFQAVETAVGSGDTVGIATPMQSGQFRVSRYGIKGWSAASQQLMRRSADTFKKPGDTTL